MSELNKTRQQLADMFLEALKSDKPMKWQKGWKNLKMPMNAVSERKYTGINKFFLAFFAEMNGYKDPRWCTFKQANDAGWKIKKGEKAVPVEYWFYYNKDTKTRLTAKEYQTLINDNPDLQERICLLSQTYSVFNAAQINGIPEIQKYQNTKIESVEKFIDTIKANMDIDIKYSGDRAFYSIEKDTINIPVIESFKNEYEFYATELHELAHATGAEHRLNRDMKGRTEKDEYAKEELRAEIASCFMSNDLKLPETGEEHNKNHIAYVKSWIEIIEDSPAELMKAIKDADVIADYLKDKGEYEKYLKVSLEKEENIANKRLNYLSGMAR